MGLYKTDIENLERAVANLVDGIAAATGESRWYIARLVEMQATSISEAEHRKTRDEKYASLKQSE